MAHSGSDDLDDLDDRVRDIAGLLTHLTTAAAFAARTVRRGRDPQSDVARRKITQLTRTVSLLGRALANLGGAVAQAGVLHQLGALPRSTERSEAIKCARFVLHRRIDSTRHQLNEAGRQLHQEADRLTTPPLPSRSPRAPITTPVPHRASPTTARTR